LRTYRTHTHLLLPPCPPTAPCCLSVASLPPSLTACAWFQSNTDGSPSLWSRVGGCLLVRTVRCGVVVVVLGAQHFCLQNLAAGVWMDDRIVRRVLLAMRQQEGALLTLGVWYWVGGLSVCLCVCCVLNDAGASVCLSLYLCAYVCVYAIHSSHYYPSLHPKPLKEERTLRCVGGLRGSFVSAQLCLSVSLSVWLCVGRVWGGVSATLPDLKAYSKSVYHTCVCSS